MKSQVVIVEKDIDKDKTIFLSLQSNYKLLPQHDNIYFEIIKFFV